MSLVAFAVGGVVLAFIAVRLFLNTSPAQLAGVMRTVVPVGLLFLGLLFLLAGQVFIGVVAAASGAAILIRHGERRRGSPKAHETRRRTAGGWSRAGHRPPWPREVPRAEPRPEPQPDTAARVRSHFLEMVLEPRTGDLTGTVLTGQFAGRRLEQMDEADLRTLLANVASDPESVRLLEAYLDRRLAGWRADAQAGMSDGLGGTPRTGAMTEQEAHQILGLQKGATVAEIRDAHRRLMKRVHPDHGGTDFLAARINEAKALLIDRHH